MRSVIALFLLASTLPAADHVVMKNGDRLSGTIIKFDGKDYHAVGQTTGGTQAYRRIDDHTLDYLRLTGRDDAQVKLVELYAKTAGLWASSLMHARYERTLQFDLSSVVRNVAGPSNPHARVATSERGERRERPHTPWPLVQPAP